MLCLTRSTEYPVGQGSNAKPTLGLLAPDKDDCEATANLIFPIFLFPVLSSLSYKSFLLPPHLVFLQKETVCFMKC